MPLEIRCSSCGFVLYRGKELKSIVDILRQWDFRCPCCLSRLDHVLTLSKMLYSNVSERELQEVLNSIDWSVEALPRRTIYNVDEFIRLVQCYFWTAHLNDPFRYSRCVNALDYVRYVVAKLGYSISEALLHSDKTPRLLEELCELLSRKLRRRVYLTKSESKERLICLEEPENKQEHDEEHD